MNQIQKKRIANSIMVLAVLLIVFSGIMAVGSIKGWFDPKGDFYAFTVKDKMGEASIERSGIAYSLQKGTILKTGDQIETLSGASFHLGGEESEITINENTRIRIKACRQSKLALQVEKGELYIRKSSKEAALYVTYGNYQISWKDANTSLSLDVQDGTQNINVLCGSVLVEGSTDPVLLKAGDTLASMEHSGGKTEQEVKQCSVGQLDDFVLQQALKWCGDESFCFGRNAITAVLEERKQEQKKANEVLLSLDKKEREKEQTGTLEKETKKAAEKETDTPDKLATKPSKKTVKQTRTLEEKKDKSLQTDSEQDLDKKPAKGGKEKTFQPGSQKPAKEKKKKTPSQKKTKEPEQKAGKTSQKPEQNTHTKEPAKEPSNDNDKKIYSCTISISCATILNHMDNLKEGKSSYVPKDGIILSTTKVEYTEGETAYDILKRACDKLEIQLEASYTPIYKSYYVEGIHNLYEFDCGKQSGWMYKVNGWYPNYGCSSYKVKDGDAIVWNYTCEGLGTDVS